VLAMTDPALFHMILCSSAFYSDFFARKESPERIVHMFAAIRIISARLSDSSFMVSDGTIAAVALLAKVEASIASVKRLAIYLTVCGSAQWDLSKIGHCI
jgi:hypothetical protein